MNFGDIIQFGKYEWKVIDKEDDVVLLLTTTIIDQRDYHDKNEPVSWGNSSLRRYLNNEFLENFSEAEKSKIAPVINQNQGNPWYYVEGSSDTLDKVFILNLDEVVRIYFKESDELLDNPGLNQRYWFERKDPNNIYRRSTYLDQSWWYWVRTPGKHDRTACYIHGDGNIGIQGNIVSKRNTNVIHPITNSNKGGVRPAMWIRFR
jgi:hypothetical protein